MKKKICFVVSGRKVRSFSPTKTIVEASFPPEFFSNYVDFIVYPSIL